MVIDKTKLAKATNRDSAKQPDEEGQGCVRKFMIELARGHQIAAMVHLAARLEIADIVGSGCHLSDLANRTSTEEDTLRRLIVALSTFGIFCIAENGQITNTRKSNLLGRSAAHSIHASILFWSHPQIWDVWRDFSVDSKVGSRAAEFFETLKGSTTLTSRFSDFMEESARYEHHLLARSLELEGKKKVIDLGGGTEGLIQALLAHSPDLRGILFDLPEVVERAAAVGTTSKRWEAIAGDFFAEVPSGGDLYILSRILHDWSDDDVRTILRNCCRAMSSDARLVIFELSLDLTSGASSHLASLSDIEMLLFTEGRERTCTEYCSLLEESGFCVVRVWLPVEGYLTIECRPRVST